MFEEFLQAKFTTHKRFGLEGMESMVSGLKWFVDCSVKSGVKDISLGMAHRGRLNVLANVVRKPISKIFAEFQGKDSIVGYGDKDSEIEYSQSGDVKYHLGTFHERVYPDGKTISLDLLPNPSHLEAVNPLVMGKTRAKQHFNNDIERNKHLCVLIHGDAAFAGQGVVYESMQMSNLANYTTGGVLHVVSNNQIGFTTTPKDGRSTPFVSDIMKAYEAPIIHVNADDPIAVDYCFSVALEYRNKFKKDICIDIIGYRKYGHNELDQPMFTQPQMYAAVSKKQNVLKMFEERLVNEKVISQEEADEHRNKIKNNLEKFFQYAENNVFDKSEWISKEWQHLNNRKYSAPQDTVVDLKTLQFLNKKINLLPTEYNFHKKIKELYDNRYKSVEEGKNIDWGTGEALCWATLLNENYTVRLSGQDVERGTFSHRHAVLHDQLKDRVYVPLHQVSDPKNFQPCNSHLSEFAVLNSR